MVFHQGEPLWSKLYFILVHKARTPLELQSVVYINNHVATKIIISLATPVQEDISHHWRVLVGRNELTSFCGVQWWCKRRRPGDYNSRSDKKLNKYDWWKLERGLRGCMNPKQTITDQRGSPGAGCTAAGFSRLIFVRTRRYFSSLMSKGDLRESILTLEFIF